jgi:hypothetical protein
MRARIDARRPILVLALLVVAGCREDGPAPVGASTAASPSAPPATAPWFEECAEARGLRFRHESGHVDRHLMPEIMCGGAALFDMDGDSDLDAYLVNAGGVDAPPDRKPPNRLFRNDGKGQFTDVTEGSGAAVPGFGNGVACGDIDNDGDVDLYVSNLGPDVLLRNDGTGHFTDITAQAGVGDPGWGASAAFLDFDRDGDLDLFVTNYLEWSARTEIECFNNLGTADYCLPRNYETPGRSTLYRNEGGGRFKDVSESSGVGSVRGTGLGVVSADFDGDGWPDVYVADDGMPNRLWKGSSKGQFVEEALLRGAAVDGDGVPKAGMGICLGDIDDDGDPDLLVGNLRGESDSLYRNDGKFFSDGTARAGLGAASRPFTRFGMGWDDFDNDGWLDLYIANGRVSEVDAAAQGDPYAEPNLLFAGLAGGRFAEVQPRGGTATPVALTSRGAAFGDVDDDGGIDILVVNRDGPASLFHDIVGGRGHWLRLRVVEHGRDALGARVEIGVGDRHVTREVTAAGSYLSSSDPRVHVGLGASTQADSVVVHWVDGARESFGARAADRTWQLTRGEGAAPP